MKFSNGTTVKHTAKFLKSVGGATGWPRSGVVTGVSSENPTWIQVKWDDGNECLVSSANIIVKGRPDYTGM